MRRSIDPIGVQTMLSEWLVRLPLVGQAHAWKGGETLSPPSPSSTMSLRPVIPWRVALQQSSPPLRRLPSACAQPKSETINLQRTASVRTCSCLTYGDHLSELTTWRRHECRRGTQECARHKCTCALLCTYDGLVKAVEIKRLAKECGFELAGI